MSPIHRIASIRSAAAVISCVFLLSCAPADTANQDNAPAKDNTPAVADNIGSDWTASQWNRWRYLLEELEILELHQAFSARHQPSEFVIRNVTLIDMKSSTGAPGQSVRVVDGRIAAIGAADEIDVPANVQIIDGAGKFLMPGLADMHVHNLESQSQHLLNLAHGVTTVRDLDGFPFLLAMRDAINEGNLLAPTMYVSGTILNGSDFGGYAIALGNEDEARAAVRDQAALGYDFIKTHNSLSAEIFFAIADEAKAQGLDVIGHIPVDVTVAEAVASGMRTFEHFKGYIDDSRLALSDEDYVAATDGADIWNTPTFTTYREHSRGDDAAAILSNEAEMQYVSPLLRNMWASFADETPDAVTKLRQNIYPMSAGIFAELRTLESAKFLAGTDSGSYAMMPPGIVLLDELSIFERLGMTPHEALMTATANAAESMRRDGEFGVIAVGARADLLLLDSNPLLSTDNLENPAGIALKGVWLDRTHIDAMLDELRAIFSRTEQRMSETTATSDQLEDMFSRLVALNDAGFPFRDHYLDLAASLYKHAGRDNAYQTLKAMKIDRDFGFSFYQFE